MTTLAMMICELSTSFSVRARMLRAAKTVENVNGWTLQTKRVSGDQTGKETG